MPKPATTIPEPSPDSAREEPAFRGLVSILRKVVRIWIPAGYEDETGFHMGVDPADKETKQRSVW